MDPQLYGSTPASFCDMKDQEDDGDEEMMKEKKINFLGGFDASFRERTSYDMLLFSHDKQPPLRAHKALLVIVKSTSLVDLMLDSESGHPMTCCSFLMISSLLFVRTKPYS